MGVAWNEFPEEIQHVIYKQLEARFRDMIPQGNIYASYYINIAEINIFFI